MTLGRYAVQDPAAAYEKLERRLKVRCAPASLRRHAASLAGAPLGAEAREAPRV